MIFDSVVLALYGPSIVVHVADLSFLERWDVRTTLSSWLGRRMSCDGFVTVGRPPVLVRPALGVLSFRFYGLGAHVIVKCLEIATSLVGPSSLCSVPMVNRMFRGPALVC